MSCPCTVPNVPVLLPLRVTTSVRCVSTPLGVVVSAPVNAEKLPESSIFTSLAVASQRPAAVVRSRPRFTDCLSKLTDKDAEFSVPVLPFWSRGVVAPSNV